MPPANIRGPVVGVPNIGSVIFNSYFHVVCCSGTSGVGAAARSFTLKPQASRMASAPTRRFGLIRPPPSSFAKTHFPNWADEPKGLSTVILFRVWLRRIQSGQPKAPDGWVPLRLAPWLPGHGIADSATS